jgi:hypothetical protein
MTRTEQLSAMAQACADHLSTGDATYVALTAMHHGERFVAYINAGHHKQWTGPEFAAFALQCAKRVHAGPAS